MSRKVIDLLMLFGSLGGLKSPPLASNGKTILARELTGICVGCSDFPFLVCAIGGEGDVSESVGHGIAVVKDAISRPFGELTGTVKPSPQEAPYIHTSSQKHIPIKNSIISH